MNTFEHHPDYGSLCPCYVECNSKCILGRVHNLQMSAFLNITLKANGD